MEYLFFPLLSRFVDRELSRRSTHRCNQIYTIARSYSHPINYPGSPEGVPGIACGISFVPVETLQRLLGIKWDSIKVHLQRGVELGFWRRYEVGNGYVKFSLRSVKKVSNRLGLDSTGGYAFVSEEEFSRLHILATEMTALEYQRRTYNAAKKNARKVKKPVYSAETLVTKQQTTSLFSGKPFVLNGFNVEYITLKEDDFPYGLSQKKIGEKRGLAESTICRHLSNRYRRRKGYPDIQKRQILIEQSNYTQADLEALSWSKDEDLLKAHNHYLAKTLSDGSTRVYKCQNNLYFDPEREHRFYLYSEQERKISPEKKDLAKVRKGIRNRKEELAKQEIDEVERIVRKRRRAEKCEISSEIEPSSNPSPTIALTLLSNTLFSLYSFLSIPSNPSFFDFRLLLSFFLS